MKATKTNLIRKIEEFCTANYLNPKGFKKMNFEETIDMANKVRFCDFQNKDYLISEINMILDEMVQQHKVAYCQECQNYFVCTKFYPPKECPTCERAHTFREEGA
jgi:rubrerythrin